MQNFIKRLSIWFGLLFISLTMTCYALTEYPVYRFALVRDLSSSFENSLKLSPPLIPIDFNLARQQHEDYIHVLESLIRTVIRIKGDSSHPDCNFIEDTAIIVGNTAVISRMGAKERRGEEVPVARVLEKLPLKKIVSIEAPGTMDGGDILYTGNHLFVGISHRTNPFALEQLKEIFKGQVEVIAVPVVDGLHLKSFISLFDSKTLVIAYNYAGEEIRNTIDKATNHFYTFVSVPDAVASNVLRIHSTLIIQNGFPESETILQDLCDQKQVGLIKINMSELIKADGALTCGCLLLP